MKRLIILAVLVMQAGMLAQNIRAAEAASSTSWKPHPVLLVGPSLVGNGYQPLALNGGVGLLINSSRVAIILAMATACAGRPCMFCLEATGLTPCRGRSYSSVFRHRHPASISFSGRPLAFTSSIRRLLIQPMPLSLHSKPETGILLPSWTLYLGGVSRV